MSSQKLHEFQIYLQPLLSGNRGIISDEGRKVGSVGDLERV